MRFQFHGSAVFHDDATWYGCRPNRLETSGVIVCAGLPRCGTTMMFGALAGIRIGGTTPKDYEGEIKKTHTFRPSRFTDARKAIFMFGDPVVSVVSTYKNRMTPGHFQNCGAGHINPEKADIFSEDILNYEKMFTSWMRRQPFDLIAVRYEALYDNLKLISAFFDDRHLYVKPRAPRRTNPETDVSAEDLSRIKTTYASLVEKVARAPDIAIYRAGLS
jgi:hypothetical protein